MKRTAIILAAMAMMGSECSADPSGQVVPSAQPTLDFTPVASIRVIGAPMVPGPFAQVIADGANSYDPEGGALSFEWTIDGMIVSHLPKHTILPFDAPGSHTLGLTVCDSAGQCDSTFAGFSQQGPKLGRWEGTTSEGGSVRFYIDGWRHVANFQFDSEFRNFCTSPLEADVGASDVSLNRFEIDYSFLTVFGEFEIGNDGPSAMTALGSIVAIRTTLPPGYDPDHPCGLYGSVAWSAQWVPD